MDRTVDLGGIEPPSAEQIAKEVSGDVEEPPPVLEEASVEETFDLDYTDARGHRWVGTFKNRVLNLSQRALVGGIKARLLGNSPLECVDAYSQTVAEMMAHLAVSLIEKPDWYNTVELYDVRVIEAVYKEVSSHEARFLGVEQQPGESR